VLLIPEEAFTGGVMSLFAAAATFPPAIAIQPSPTAPFLDLHIGTVASANRVGAGLVGPGNYWVVYNECGDGVFNPLWDSAPAFVRVSIPGYPDVHNHFKSYHAAPAPALGETQAPAAMWTMRRGDETGPLLVGAPALPGGTAGVWAADDTGTLPAFGPSASPVDVLNQFPSARAASFNGVAVRPGASASEGAALVFRPQKPGRLTSFELLAEVLSNAGDGVQVSVVLRTDGGRDRTLVAPFTVQPTPSGHYYVQASLDPAIDLCTCDSVAIRVLAGTTNLGDDANIGMTLGIAPPTSWSSPHRIDFNNLTPGSISGQDGWYSPAGSPPSLTVSAGSGFDGSNTLSRTTPTNVGSTELRNLPHTFSYGGPNATWTMRGRVVGGAGEVRISMYGLDSSGSQFIAFGIGEEFPGLRTLLWGTTTGDRGGDLLIEGHWYEVQAFVDLTVPMAHVTLRYRDLTLGESQFTTDSVLTNVPMALVPANGSFNFTRLFARMDNGPGCCPQNYLDDISFPDPSVTSITSQPQAGPACLGGVATLTVAGDSLGRLSFQWQAEELPVGSNRWLDLHNGILPGSSAVVDGAGSAQIAISGLDSAAMNRRLRCQVINSCTIVESDAVSLVVLPDLNGDAMITTADLTLLLVRFGQTVPPGSVGDINADGVVNTADLTRLLVAFGRSCSG